MRSTTSNPQNSVELIALNLEREQSRGTWHALRRLFFQYKPQFRWLWTWIIRWRSLLQCLPLDKIPVSSKYFGRPKGFHLTTFDYLTSCAGRINAGSATEVFPAETLEFTLPTPLTGHEVHPNFVENQHKKMPASYVFDLARGRFWGHYGGSILGADDRLLADLSHDVLGLAHHKIFTKLQLPRCRTLSGVTAVLSTAEAAMNYWHWTFDLLPRFHLLERAGFTPTNVDRYLVNHTNLAFQLESLADLGIRPEQIFRTDKNSHYECERLVVSSLKPSQLHVTKWACEFLRTGAEPVIQTVQQPRRILISREHDSFRRLTNEEEVFAALKPHGFERVHCETLTVREQRRVFSEAEIVVAPHGAGMSNLVFCRPGATVIELFAPDYVDLSMWPHISHCSLRHLYLIGKGGTAGASSTRRSDNVTICVETLVTLVVQTILARAHNAFTTV